MRLALLAIGRLKRGPEQDLADRYRTRADALGRSLGIGPLDVAEFAEGRGRSAAERQAEEAAALLARVGTAKLVAFDERGTSLTSEEFAATIGRWRDEGTAAACVVGGPDGLSAEIRARATLVLSFGRLTMPHGIVRALVLEQLYRSMTILAGHPYHRGEP